MPSNARVVIYEDDVINGELDDRIYVEAEHHKDGLVSFWVNEAALDEIREALLTRGVNLKIEYGLSDERGNRLTSLAFRLRGLIPRT